ncbi:DUF559 domain-containing protein [Candidatus Woesearchaeota archaeon]|nr:DUF559 domain-containing protein [Candidatus Woesearchaeota archaeon]
MKFKKGHVPWNKGLSKDKDPRVAEIGQKISKVKKLLYSRGKIVIWNKGKNKKIDKRLIKQGITSSLTKKNKYACGELVPWNKGKKGLQVPWNKGKKGLQVAWNKGLSKETNLKIRRQAESITGNWEKKYGKEHAKQRIEKIRTARLKQPVTKISYIEKITKQILLDLGCKEKSNITECKDFLDFVCQEPIAGICIPDFIFPVQKKILNCDGDFWHGNIKFYPKLNKMQKKRRKNDKMQNKILKEKGWIVLRFWEHFIKKDTGRYIPLLSSELKIFE